MFFLEVRVQVSHRNKIASEITISIISFWIGDGKTKYSERKDRKLRKKEAFIEIDSNFEIV
jgi:hypothetical protein